MFVLFCCVRSPIHSIPCHHTIPYRITDLDTGLEQDGVVTMIEDFIVYHAVTTLTDEMTAEPAPQQTAASKVLKLAKEMYLENLIDPKSSLKHCSLPALGNLRYGGDKAHVSARTTTATDNQEVFVECSLCSINKEDCEFTRTEFSKQLRTCNDCEDLELMKKIKIAEDLFLDGTQPSPRPGVRPLLVGDVLESLLTIRGLANIEIQTKDNLQPVEISTMIEKIAVGLVKNLLRSCRIQHEVLTATSPRPSPRHSDRPDRVLRSDTRHQTLQSESETEVKMLLQSLRGRLDVKNTINLTRSSGQHHNRREGRFDLVEAGVRCSIVGIMIALYWLIERY